MFQTTNQYNMLIIINGISPSFNIFPMILDFPSPKPHPFLTKPASSLCPFASCDWKTSAEPWQRLSCCDLVLRCWKGLFVWENGGFMWFLMGFSWKIVVSWDFQWDVMENWWSHGISNGILWKKTTLHETPPLLPAKFQAKYRVKTGCNIFWLVVDLPLWKTWKSVGMIIPNIWKNQIHVSNHQPVFVNRMRLPNGSNLTMLKDLKDLFSWLSQLWAQLYWSPFGHIWCWASSICHFLLTDASLVTGRFVHE